MTKLGKALQAAAGNAAEATYIEDVFSTYLYTGNGSAQTITNGIDLAGEGGLVWIKDRNSGAKGHGLFDTERGGNYKLQSQSTNGQFYATNQVTSFNANGFSLGSTGDQNGSGTTYASWTFRKAEKFFDVVTYTGDGVAGRTVAHNLGSVPGCIIVKRTDTTSNWQVYHRSLANTEYLVLNTTAAKATGATRWNSTTPTSTVFSLGTDATVNASGGTYVAYLFAHDAGGFGEDGTENVISCGSYTGNGAAVGNLVNVGFEPQWILIKASVSPDNTQDWRLVDNMRGIPMSDQDMILAPNTAAAETDSITCDLAPTGFYPTGPNYNSSGFTYIYIAIRRGPMKVPTSGTEVFAPVAYTGDNSSNRVIGSLPAGDSALVFTRNYNEYAYPQTWWSRLTGGYGLRPYSTNAEVDQSTTLGWANQIGQLISIGSTNINYGGSPVGNFVLYNFKRAPSFFDVVAYSGNSVTGRTVPHNLGVAPEMMIVKSRSNASYWQIYHSALGATKYMEFGTNTPNTNSARWNNTTPTASDFILGADDSVNISGRTYIAYLFATLAGVSKVGSYTGTATTNQIDCGFSGGARFVLIRRTDSTGDWYVWDSARGIVAGNDPYLLLNSTAAEVTGNDYIDPYSAGFEISSTAPVAINASGGSYIFLAIA